MANNKHKKQQRRTKAEIRRLVKVICNDYADSDYTIYSVCKAHGVPYRTFKSWIDKDTKLAEIYKKAHETEFFDKDLFVRTAKLSLLKKLEGYKVKETTYHRAIDKEGNILKDDDGNPKMVIAKEIEKEIAPSDTLIIFTLANHDGWKRQDKVEPSNITLSVTQKSTEELIEEKSKLLASHGDEMPEI